jgi:hypothetical protein
VTEVPLIIPGVIDFYYKYAGLNKPNWNQTPSSLDVVKFSVSKSSQWLKKPQFKNVYYKLPGAEKAVSSRVAFNGIPVIGEITDVFGGFRSHPKGCNTAFNLCYHAGLDISGIAKASVGNLRTSSMWNSASFGSPHSGHELVMMIDLGLENKLDKGVLYVYAHIYASSFLLPGERYEPNVKLGELNSNHNNSHVHIDVAKFTNMKNYSLPQGVGKIVSHFRSIGDPLDRLVMRYDRHPNKKPTVFEVKMKGDDWPSRTSSNILGISQNCKEYKGISRSAHEGLKTCELVNLDPIKQFDFVVRGFVDILASVGEPVEYYSTIQNRFLPTISFIQSSTGFCVMGKSVAKMRHN